MQQEVLKLLKLKSNYVFSSEYHKTYENADDFRELISPKVETIHDKQFKSIPYMQVFEPRHGFISNLSIIDVLFNQGSKALEHI